ncbi:uncharacterized protein PGTG_14698 [Puccinia graminis f. sp. tritici CRL 75-36-700-3]|uniref:Retrotransposon Copia-like N-terminal domain-containing protein n=1 Tax=Puccinia graminis f. sp. tritici (strain CRL 75-36-700-3 / race SCCL) TaxID=418459 RepID=E3KWR5_PUCGT|nr:uncharacterized protein PGTG_14698 [Puccinia graminis f. sp. tritici CRL 75-36-700-3]EFP88732.2 hypothetical protein PGTG_14698 [Puccinia graminis f. sp. tritici CRL 75-36-700-3]
MATEIVRESKILLNNDNYALWLLPMKAKLHKAKSLTIVTGIHTCPDPEKDKENAKLYVKLNEDAYAEIVQHLNQEVLAYVSSTQTETDEFNGYKLWQLLKQKYAGNDLTSRTTALKKYLAVEYDSFSAFLPLIRSANQKIVLSKLALDDQVKTILMLDKLPPEFHSFKTNISMNFETESFEEVLKKLEDFAAQNQLNELKKRSTSPISSQATMYTRSSDPDIVCPHCKRGFRVCSHCFKSGHTEDSCYQKHPKKRAPKSVASSSKQHSSHLTRYTQEDKEYLQQKYPDLHL